MITDEVVTAVKSYLADSGRSELAGVSFYERDGASDIQHPSCVVVEEGIPEEHDIIKGQWTLNLGLVLRSIPEATSETTHRNITQAINDLVGNSASFVEHLSESLQCEDSWGGQGMTEAEDGYRQTTFSVEIKAAEQS